MQSQLDALGPVCKRIIPEKISTRVKTRPELEKALKLAYDIKDAAPDQEVILTAHELKRLARDVAELMILSGRLRAAGLLASVHRALAEAEETGAPAGPESIAPRRPTRVDLTGPGSGTTDAVGTVAEQTEDQANDVAAALLAHARHRGEHA
ncbi:recombinase family protein [Streptomyces caeruleatus]|uniref:Resolvase/invertase-type recombinase catalytic domain-containing protein n=1 Tax=Streptomyces caeruleatus TaxID=661399 RepID=A0A124I7W4_9ACTN|nr:hypothetical protein AQJ67_29235 [Streptomyces caeruleatus]